MTRLREQIDTPLAIDDVFAFVADFANLMYWDPGVVMSERTDPGPMRIGSRYRLEIRRGGGTVPMEYRITALVPGHRVILAGEGAGVSAVDDIRFESAGTGTRIHYEADIRLRGVTRLLEPFFGPTFAGIVRSARDGLQEALDGRAMAREEAAVKP